MVIEAISNLSFLVSSISFLALSLLFADALLVRFELKTLIKSLGFAGVAISQLLYLLHFSATLPFWILAISLSLIFISFILDPFSKFKLLLPLPIFLLPFLPGHLLLFALALLTTLAIFYLAYTTRHWDLVPLGVGFSLLSVGEYLYYLQVVENLQNLSATGAFLYLFASIVFLGWTWSYLAIRVVRLFRSG